MLFGNQIFSKKKELSQELWEKLKGCVQCSAEVLISIEICVLMPSGRDGIFV